MSESLDSVVARILAGLRRRGYHYEPIFGLEDDGAIELVRLARTLGEVYVAAGMDNDLPVLVTEPVADAPSWRPFDRPERIGWHNDFSTMEERPVLSLAWIARADPVTRQGDWRAVSCGEVLDVLARDPQIDSRQLREEPLPFGYTDSGEPSFFPLVSPMAGEPDLEELRFYGRALREGAVLRFGSVPAETERLITSVESAADAVGETLAATTHALLICHNGLAMHDRTEQTTTEGRSLRKSILCFVRTLY